MAQRRGLTETAWRGSTVEATSLTKLLEEYPDVNGVKVDAQGAEVDIVAAVRDWRNVQKLVLEYDFEYRPSLRAFHAFVDDLRKHFSSVNHAKLKRTGDFVGFPNGVLVFATREAPPVAPERRSSPERAAAARFDDDDDGSASDSEDDMPVSALLARSPVARRVTL